jgi:hypothetical protein
MSSQKELYQSVEACFKLFAGPAIAIFILANLWPAGNTYLKRSGRGLTNRAEGGERSY